MSMGTKKQGIGIFALAMIMSLGLGFSLEAQTFLPKDARCRQRISIGTARYYRYVVSQHTRCHRLQMKGKLPPFSSGLDCNHMATWAANGYQKGVEAIARQSRLYRERRIARCQHDPSTPPEIGFSGCPAPCDAVVPSIVDFFDVADCMKCLTDICIEEAMTTTYNTPPLLALASDRDPFGCQDRIGREVQEHGHKRFRFQALCQYRQELLVPKFLGVDCFELENPVHPFFKGYQRWAERVDTRILKRCGKDPAILGSILDSCATDAVNEAVCVKDAVEQCTDGLFTAIYPNLPTSTPTITPTPSPTPTQTPVPDGGACTLDDQCLSGICAADGVCCDGVCTGGCESCLGSSTGGDDGKCLPVAAGTDPDVECDDGNECTADSCNGSGACQNPDEPTGTSCGDGSDTECTNPDTCDGAGACLDNHETGGTTCGDTGTECVVQDTCDGVGACTDNGFVANGTNCGDAGTECIVQDSCDGAGVCTDNGFVSSGTGCGDGSDTECTDPDTCDGSGACLDNHESSGTNCGDAGTECTVQDSCDGSGGCTDNGFIVNGTACGDASDTECTDPDTCNGAGTCLDNHEAGGTNCGDTGTECIVQDTCDGSGSCADNGFVSSGTGCGSASDTECTNPDTCNGAGTCQVNDELSGTSCGDAGTECVVQDTCNGSGSCTDNGFIGSGTNCGAGATECSNQDTCNGAGTCQPNHVSGGTNCGDTGTDCINQDLCDGSGSCTDNGFVSSGTACTTDSDVCTDDECNGAGSCNNNINTDCKYVSPSGKRDGVYARIPVCFDNRDWSGIERIRSTDGSRDVHGR